MARPRGRPRGSRNKPKGPKQGKMVKWPSKGALSKPKVVTINQKGIVFPDRYRTTMRYTNVFDLDPAGTNPQVYKEFRLNSVWDPDPAVTVGNTCAGWTELNAIYRKYIVKGARVKVTFVPAYSAVSTASPSSPCQFLIVPYDKDAFVVDNTLGELTGAAYAKYKTVIPNSMNTPVVLSSYYDMKKISGYPYLVQDYIATGNTNPVKDLRFAVFLTGINKTLTLDTAGVVMVDILYYVEWFDRKGSHDFGLEE